MTENIDLKRLMTLSRLNLTKDEQEEIKKDLTQMVDWIEKLKTINTDNVYPLINILDNIDAKNATQPKNDTQYFISRNDEEGSVSNDTREDVVSNSQSFHDNFFTVTKIIE